jgi:hypothetical protein
MSKGLYTESGWTAEEWWKQAFQPTVHTLSGIVAILPVFYRIPY